MPTPKTTPSERRKQFFDYFRDRVACIVTTQPPPSFMGRIDFNTFKLLLVCAHLEALAKARYAPRDSYGKNTRDSAARFRRLLEEESGLSHIYSLVALPRAQSLFERRRDEARAQGGSATGDVARQAVTDAELADRAATVLRRLVLRQGHHEARDSFRVGESETLDLRISQVRDSLRADGVDPSHRLVAQVLRDERYSGIVWREVRCGLVHEARVLREGFDLGEDRLPYYFSEEDLATRQVTYPLVIPAKFLLRTLQLCVDRFEAFCSHWNVDPYSCFDIP